MRLFITHGKSCHAIRCWEQNKSDPSHDTLVAICKLYHISADYLLGLTDEDRMLPLAEMTVNKELSVREVEALVRKYNAVPEDLPEMVEDNAAMQRRIYMKDLEDKLRTKLGRKVKISDSGKKKTVELTFEDDDDLANLLKTLVGQDIFE